VTYFDVWDALVSPEWLELDTPARAVCVVHSMQPLPNQFGLLFFIAYAIGIGTESAGAIGLYS